MISLPLYCKSIKQINCFKRQTANILSSVPSNHSLKRQRRQVANVPKSFVRTSDEKWPSIAGGPMSKQSPPIVHLRSASLPAPALGRIRRKCTDCNHLTHLGKKYKGPLTTINSTIRNITKKRRIETHFEIRFKDFLCNFLTDSCSLLHFFSTTYIP